MRKLAITQAAKFASNFLRALDPRLLPWARPQRAARAHADGDDIILSRFIDSGPARGKASSPTCSTVERATPDGLPTKSHRSAMNDGRDDPPKP
ncbi:MAG TPA: hypothetical protein VKX28_18910 [Xanthobacteraceae bacterium]|jgi:hypothetical protein|nr:hypothetical protein [Xanthobacteraceae bacterium]